MKEQLENEAGGRIQKRWMASRKNEAVLRLLQGEAVDGLSRESGVPIRQLESWKATVLERVELVLKDGTEEPLATELDATKREIGQLQMEVGLLRSLHSGRKRHFLHREIVEMSQTLSPAANRSYGLKKVCEAWGVSRASVYRHVRGNTKTPCECGPEPITDEHNLFDCIREEILRSPFTGEGHCRVHARLKKSGVKVGRNRVLAVMRQHQLSPHRSPYRAPNPHDRQIITDDPNVTWGSDGTRVKAVDECLGWHMCRTGGRFAALDRYPKAVNAYRDP